MATIIRKQSVLELFDAQVDALFQYTFAQVNDRQEALTLIQDVFIDMWRETANGSEPQISELYEKLDEHILGEFPKAQYEGNLLLSS